MHYQVTGKIQCWVLGSEVGCKHLRERAPIHRLLMVEKTAVDWDLIAPPGNAIIRNAKVR